MGVKETETQAARGVTKGQTAWWMAVSRIDLATGGRLGPLTTGVAGDGGWVDLTEPITVRAGDAFITVTECPDR